MPSFLRCVTMTTKVTSNQTIVSLKYIILRSVGWTSVNSSRVADQAVWPPHLRFIKSGYRQWHFVTIANSPSIVQSATVPGGNRQKSSPAICYRRSDLRVAHTRWQRSARAGTRQAQWRKLWHRVHGLARQCTHLVQLFSGNSEKKCSR